MADETKDQLDLSFDVALNVKVGGCSRCSQTTYVCVDGVSSPIFFVGLIFFFLPLLCRVCSFGFMFHELRVCCAAMCWLPVAHYLMN
jgi:hypothetical protein